MSYNVNSKKNFEVQNENKNDRNHNDSYSTVLYHSKCICKRIHSINKYKEEEFNDIIRSYDNKGLKDGYIVVGTFLKETEDLESKNVMIVKYSPNGKIMWEYNYGQERNETLYGITYLYDSEENINGYIIMLSEESEQIESTEKPSFIMLNLEGKKLFSFSGVGK